MLCSGVAIYHRYGVCTVWWCGGMSQVWCVYCVVVWQHVTDMVCLLCGGVAVFHMYGICTLWKCGSVLYVLCVYCVEV